MVVTVRDVARASGVSISTVSRALSDPSRVAAPTRDRVLAAAEHLGYERNRAAAGLRSGRTGTLGVVVPDLENPYFASVVKGAQARSRDHGYGVFVVDVEEDASREADEVRALLARTDGVVVASPRSTDDDLAALIGERHGRAVLVNRNVPGVPSVTGDEAGGAGRALDHLRALGHRRIAYIGGPAGSWSDRNRRAGLRAAAERAGDVELLEVASVRPHVQGGYSAADLVPGARATAVVAYNDLVAIGIERRLLERGLAVPGDVSVVGFDDTFVASLAAAPLTSVGPDLRAVGAAAVELLVRRLKEPDAPVADVVQPVELVVRASTSAVPVGLVVSA